MAPRRPSRRGAHQTDAAGAPEWALPNLDVTRISHGGTETRRHGEFMVALQLRQTSATSLSMSQRRNSRSQTSLLAIEVRVPPFDDRAPAEPAQEFVLGLCHTGSSGSSTRPRRAPPRRTSVPTSAPGRSLQDPRHVAGAAEFRPGTGRECVDTLPAIHRGCAGAGSDVLFRCVRTSSGYEALPPNAGRMTGGRRP